jgi:nitrogen fixation NifU-like protein
MLQRQNLPSGYQGISGIYSPSSAAGRAFDHDGRGNAAGRFISRRQTPAPVGSPEGASYNCLSMYSEQLLDHFQNPRNAGEISDADAVVEIENPVCGDVLRLTLKESAGRITEVKFKARGCVAVIACGSALTELATGMTLNEARKLLRGDVSVAVGGLPPASTHAAQLAIDALGAALSGIKS